METTIQQHSRVHQKYRPVIIFYEHWNSQTAEECAIAFKALLEHPLADGIIADDILC